MKRAVVAWVPLLAFACGLGCFERGKAKRRQDDAGPTSPARAALVAPPMAKRPPGAVSPDSIITIALAAEPSHLDPSLAQDALAVRVALGDIYEGLLSQVQPGGSVTPCVASKYQASDDGRHWRFTLRDGVVFHDGRSVTSDDVVSSFRNLDSSGSILSADFDDLVQVRGRGRKVEFSFRESRRTRLEAFARVPIVPKHRGAATRRRRPVGTGPLRLAQWEPGLRLRLERNSSYWGDKSASAEIVYRFFSSRQQSIAAVRAGDVDLVMQVPASEVGQPKSGVGVFSYAMPAYHAAVYNTRRSPLDRAAVRRALTLSMDRSGMASALFGGEAAVVSGPFFSNDPALKGGPLPLPFDRAAARALVVGKLRSLELLVPSKSSVMARVADIWAQDARGIAELKVVRRPFASVLERLRDHDFDVVLMSFSTGKEVDLYTQFHSSQRDGQNYSGIGDDDLDAMLVKLRTAGEERAAVERSVAERLHELQPYAFIASDRRLGLVRSDTGGFERAGPHSFARFLWRSNTR